MSLSDVQAALISTAEGCLNDRPIAMINMPFDPPQDSKWAQINFLPNTPTPFELGIEGNDIVTGLLQIDLNYPVFNGDAEGRKDYEMLRKFFSPRAPRPLYNGQEVIITQFGRSQGRTWNATYDGRRNTGVRGSGWFAVICAVYWYALIR